MTKTGVQPSSPISVPAAPQILGWGSLLWKLVGEASNIDFIMSIQASSLREAFQFALDYGVVALCLVGFAWWLAINLKKLPRPSLGQTMAAIALMSFLWGFLIAVEATSSVPRVIGSWAVGGGCDVTLLSPVIQKFKKKYDVAFICGIADAKADKLTDVRVSISRAYNILPEPFSAYVPFSPEMKAALPTTPGSPVSTWFMSILVVKGQDMKIIHNLADVTKYGGKLLEEGYFE